MTFTFDLEPSQWVSILGISFDLVGVIILFFTVTGHFELDDNGDITPRDPDEELISKRKGLFALRLIAVGFLLQILAYFCAI